MECRVRRGFPCHSRRNFQTLIRDWVPWNAERSEAFRADPGLTLKHFARQEQPPHNVVALLLTSVGTALTDKFRPPPKQVSDAKSNERSSALVEALFLKERF